MGSSCYDGRDSTIGYFIRQIAEHQMFDRKKSSIVTNPLGYKRGFLCYVIQRWSHCLIIQSLGYVYTRVNIRHGM